MLTNKSNILYVLSVLKEYSDEKHILSMGEIRRKIKILYDKDMDRRTVGDMIRSLIDFGYDIETYEENKKGYYLRERAFEASEIRFLIDRVYSSNFISKKQTENIIHQLEKQLSVHQRKTFKHLHIIKDNNKKNEQQIFLNIEILEEAISKNKKVALHLYEYGFDKKLKKRRQEKDIINPYQMVSANERYYLIGNFDRHSNMVHLRLDMIKNIEILEEKRKAISDVKENLKNDSDIIQYSNSLFHKFDGDKETVEILCHKTMLGEVIDKFGNDATIIERENDKFSLILKVSPTSIKFWALSYLSYCEVIKPIWLREEIEQTISNTFYCKV
ncbi:MAG: helix-turn-helix transcriptional regulator [Anaerovoracaceae bacterium]